MANKKVTGWFTMSGRHIPLFEGESKDDAVKRAVKNVKSPKVTQSVFKSGERRAYDKADKELNQASKQYDAGKISSADLQDAYNKRDEMAYNVLESKKSTSEKLKDYKSKKSTAEKNEDIKEKQITQAKADADKASGKVTRKDVEDLTAKKDALKGAKLSTKPISKEEVDAQKKQWGLNKKPIKTKSVSFVTGNGTSQSIGNAMDISKFKDDSDIVKKNSFLSKYANASDRAGAYLKHLVENSKQDKDSLLKVLKSNVSGKVDYYKYDNEKYIFRVYDPWGNKSYMYVYKK